jgi:DNA-directed RNA polymerase specialized sigma24 family protein
MVDLNQQQSTASSSDDTRRPPPSGFEEFFRASYRELVKTAMYAGATQQEAEDAVAKTLMEMLQRWDTCQRSLP